MSVLMDETPLLALFRQQHERRAQVAREEQLGRQRRQKVTAATEPGARAAGRLRGRRSFQTTNGATGLRPTAAAGESSTRAHSEVGGVDYNGCARSDARHHS